MSANDGLTPTRFVRGGQSTQHWFRMAGQVFTTFVAVFLFIFGLVLVFLIYTNFTIDEVRLSFLDTVVRYFHKPLGHLDYVIDTRGISGLTEGMTAGEYLADESNHDRIKELSRRGWFLFWISTLPAAVAGFLVVLLYARTGKGLGKTKHERGSKLVTPAQLHDWSKQKWKKFYKDRGKDAGGPQYTIAGIPFPPENVMAQTGIFGTTGVGKTVALTELLQTIRKEKGRAIVYDRMGALVEKFYDPTKGDKIINPFDERSVAWSPFYEASDIASFAQMAEVLIPIKANAPDPFWQTTARLVFESAAKKLFQRGDDNNKSMREAIALMPDEELIELLVETPAAQLLNEKNPKTASSIRANLIAELRFFEFLRDDGERFSIRDWVKDETIDEGFVFLTGDSEHAAATRNVISACLEIASNALMTCESGVDYPKIWFIVDELPTLNRLPFIEKSLAEIRQFGGAYVLGFQANAQLEDIYGQAGAQIITGNVNNRIIFNSPDFDTCEKASRSLGMEDVVDQRHNITMGAHSTRDGVGFSEQRVERFIATASEIQSLPKLEAYLRFGYDAPAAKVEFTPISVERKGPKVLGYMPYEGSGFAVGSLELKRPEGKDGPAVPVSIKRLPKREMEEAEQWALFEGWQSYWREKGVQSAVVQHFTPNAFEIESDAYESAYWDQRNGWDMLFQGYANGVDPKDLDPRIGPPKASPELKAALRKVMPPYPITWRDDVVEEAEVIEETPAPQQQTNAPSNSQRAMAGARPPSNQTQPDQQADTKPSSKPNGKARKFKPNRPDNFDVSIFEINASDLPAAAEDQT